MHECERERVHHCNVLIKVEEECVRRRIDSESVFDSAGIDSANPLLSFT